MITTEGNELLIKFSHHPQLVGHLKASGENTFICFYDPVTWGVKEIPFTVVDGKVVSCSVSVNEFIDYDSYVFTRK
jgi:hypothetical protein